MSGILNRDENNCKYMHSVLFFSVTIINSNFQYAYK